MADEQSALCRTLHIEVDRRLKTVETDAQLLRNKVENLTLKMENFSGMVKGAVIVGSAAGGIVGTLISIAFRIFG